MSRLTGKPYPAPPPLKKEDFANRFKAKAPKADAPQAEAPKAAKKKK